MSLVAVGGILQSCFYDDDEADEVFNVHRTYDKNIQK